MNPKVSILWVNYNSSSFIELALESLRAIRDIDYSNYELIIVDNGSNDGSFEILTDFLLKSNVDCKIIRLEKNMGFTGGNNAAYAARSRESKYFVLLNNDAVPKRGSLGDLVELMDNDESLGAAQGVILNIDERSVDTAGDYLSELLEGTSLFQGNSPGLLTEPVYSTSADAAYSVFRVKAINMIHDQNGLLFDDYLFGYFDDHILGLKLWNNGFKVRVFPLITAKHRRGTSFGKSQSLQTYLRMRNLLILNEISNSRYKDLIRILCLRQVSTFLFQKTKGSATSPKHGSLSTLASRAFIDGIRVGRARHRLGDRINIYKAPILEVAPSDAILGASISLKLIRFHLEKGLNKIAMAQANSWNLVKN